MLTIIVSPDTLHLLNSEQANLYTSSLAFPPTTTPHSTDEDKLLEGKTEPNELVTSASLQQVTDCLNEDNLSSGLRQGLLQDLLISLEKRFKKSIRLKSDKAAPALSWQKKLLIGLGLGAGVLSTICDSFGSMSVLLTTVITDAALGFGLLWASLGFALLCVGLSLLYQICMLAKSEKVSWLKVPQTLAHYVKERQMINELIKFMDSGRFLIALGQGEVTAGEFASLKKMIKAREQCLKAKAVDLEQARRAGLPTFLRGLAVGGLGLWLLVCGFMFGFFAFSMIPMLIPTVVLPLWAFLLFGGVTGVAALVTFMVFMREDVSGAVDRLIGLDESCIAELAVGVEEVNLDEIHILQNQVDAAIPVPPPHSQPLFTHFAGSVTPGFHPQLS